MLSISFGLCVGMLGVAILGTPFGRRIELYRQQIFFELRGPLPKPKEVLLVSIDNESYDALNLIKGIAPPRVIFAQALERLAEAPPRLLILDLRIAKMSGDPDSDLRIAHALKRLPSTIVGGSTAPGAKNKVESDSQFTEAVSMTLPMEIPYDSAEGRSRI